MLDARKIVARYLFAMEHASPEALEKYLKQHPKANRSNHAVKKPGPKKSAPKAEPKSAPARKTSTELTGVLKPSTEDLDATVKEHKSLFDKLDAQVTKDAEAFESTRVRVDYDDDDEIDPTDLMAKAYPKLSLAEKRIHVGGHLVGEQFEKGLSGPEAKLHDWYLNRWRTTAGSYDHKGMDNPEDYDHSSTELQGLVGSLGVSGHPAPEDEQADKVTSGGVTKARKKGAKDPKLVQHVKKMYEYQQAYFRNAGVKELTLYRGVKGTEVDGAPSDSNIKIQSRELASFTSDPNIAKKFGRVVEFRVPVDRVFASSLVRPDIGSETSPNTFKEAEFLIMGASDLEGKTTGKPINRKTASGVVEVPISDENADWLKHTRKVEKSASIAERVFRRFQASLSDDLESRMEGLLSSPLNGAAAQSLGKWLEEKFSFQGTKTPKGQKQLKEDVKKLHWALMYGIGIHGETGRVRDTIVSDWEKIKKSLPDLVKHFSEEGGKVVPKEISLNGNTYVNVSGFYEAELTKYAKRVDAVFDELKAWRRKALSGGVRVALAGPKDFRGTSTGRYKSDEDTLYIRATPAVMKRDGSKYAGVEYIIAHELGHRFERKNRVPEDFDKVDWWTTRYSREDGESFAELFALSNFGLKGQWDAAILDRFETVMGGS